MGKGKLRKFEQLKTFHNVFEPSLEEVLDKDFKLKNKWSSDHFKNNKPLILELGCGKGEYTVGPARIFPEKNFIGIDIKGARIWAGAKIARNENLPNVAFVRTQIEFVKSFFGQNEVDEIWLTFPDPQLKKRRIKKRLTAPRFLNMYSDILKDQGFIHLKTDNAVLYKYTLDMVKSNDLPLVFATDDLYGSSQSEIVFGIQTYYEQKFISEGLKIHYLKFELPNGKIIKD